MTRKLLTLWVVAIVVIWVLGLAVHLNRVDKANEREQSEVGVHEVVYMGVQ